MMTGHSRVHTPSLIPLVPPGAQDVPSFPLNWLLRAPGVHLTPLTLAFPVLQGLGKGVSLCQRHLRSGVQ